MTEHTATDPACVLYAVPTTKAERRRFNRARGLSCKACQPPLTVPRASVERHEPLVEDEIRGAMLDATKRPEQHMPVTDAFGDLVGYTESVRFIDGGFEISMVITDPVLRDQLEAHGPFSIEVKD